MIKKKEFSGIPGKIIFGYWQFLVVSVGLQKTVHCLWMS